MKLLPLRRRLRLVRDRRGSVALEMAFVLPLILLMLLGFYEAYMYIRSVAMVERASASVANIMGRQLSQLRDCNNASDALNLGTYVDAVTRMTSPMPLATQGEVILSAVSNVNNVPRVRWQRRSQFKVAGTVSVLGVQNAQAKLPAALNALVIADNTVTILVVEITYRFVPFAMTANFWSGSPGAVTIQRVAYFRPRTVDSTTLVTAGTAGCTALPTPPA